ncbi:DUF952 domain-containing protein [Streptomyces xiaopingdaonensis]|uniref:DUF952 domain-containing protein n=1 Tax=Streptomyces xiaopingdaonensis TaxID=1565415 RepID=UPI0002DBD70E|nr:DUF952 domain-containing protein [Streptomyces xiaopingdaonensis]
MIFHVVPLDDWLVDPDRPFSPKELGEDGSVPCTRDEEAALAAADAYFGDVPGPVMALMIDEEKLDAKVRWDPGPRIHGRINRTAVAGMLEVQRDHEGRAVSLALWS